MSKVPRHSPASVSGPWTALWRDTRGITALTFGLLAVPLTLAAGMALDLGVAYYLKARLAFAVDAAALAVGSTVSDEVDVDERAANFFSANYPDTVVGTTHDLAVSIDGDVITVSATATFDTFFLKIAGKDTITVTASSEVIRAIKGLEVALVLDNTGSMRTNDNIATLRTATEDFIDILFGDETEHPNLYMAIVPYAASVNPGPEALDGETAPTAPDWWPVEETEEATVVPIKTRSSSTVVAMVGTKKGGGGGGGSGGGGGGGTGGGQDDEEEEEETVVSVPFTYDPDSGEGWKGCVIERTGDDLLGDDSTSGWTAMAWEPDPSNDYDANDIPGTILYDPSTYGNGATGPNLGCPSAIVPLTNVKSTLIDSISDLDAWNRGGTLTDIGMAWGRRVLSPEAPFTEGKDYDEEDWEKAIVLMTDGENQFYKLESEDDPNEENTDVYSDYTGLEWLSSDNERIGTNSTSEAQSIVNSRLADLCEEIKDLGVIIYTVTFTSSVSSSTKEIYKACATDTTKWFDSPTQEDLEDSFEAIAIELSKLRVSR